MQSILSNQVAFPLTPYLDRKAADNTEKYDHIGLTGESTSESPYRPDTVRMGTVSLIVTIPIDEYFDPREKSNIIG